MLLLCVCGCAGTQVDGTSDSDSDTEDQIDFKINDWLIFQMDRNVSEQLFYRTGVRTTVLVPLCILQQFYRNVSGRSSILMLLTCFLSSYFMCLFCRQAARLVYEMRHKWQNLFIKKMRFPSKPWSQQDEAIIHAVVSVGFSAA